MRFLLTCLLTTCAMTEVWAGAIDFSPTSGQRELEGIVFSNLIFHQDGHEISYEPPKGWTYSGSSNQFILLPPGASQTRGTFSESQLNAPQIFDEASLAQLRQFVLTSFPPDAQEASIASEEANPLKIHGEPTYEIIATYKLFGEQKQVGVIFASAGDVQLRFRFSGSKENFPALYRAFRASLFTLHWQ
jgi:hypothetical protein